MRRRGRGRERKATVAGKLTWRLGLVRRSYLARAVRAALTEEGLSNDRREAREQLPEEFATFFETEDPAE